MKWKVSFWYKKNNYSVIIDLEKVRLDEFLICLDKQYPSEILK